MIVVLLKTMAFSHKINDFLKLCLLIYYHVSDCNWDCKVLSFELTLFGAEFIFHILLNLCSLELVLNSSNLSCNLNCHLLSTKNFEI